MSAALTFATVLPGLLVAHTVADHWVQSHQQAAHKHLPGWPGRLACAAHIATYTATTTLTVGLLWVLLDLAISPLGFAMGQLVSAVSHYWADRRFTLQALCERLGKGDFYRLGAPRDVRAATKQPPLTGSYAGTYTATTAAGRVIDVELVDRNGNQVSWDNPTLGTGAYHLDQTWHWAWLGVAALLTAVIP